MPKEPVVVVMVVAPDEDSARRVLGLLEDEANRLDTEGSTSVYWRRLADGIRVRFFSPEE
jgi:hypothetical protein